MSYRCSQRQAQCHFRWHAVSANSERQQAGLGHIRRLYHLVVVHALDTADQWGVHVCRVDQHDLDVRVAQRLVDAERPPAQPMLGRGVHGVGAGHGLERGDASDVDNGPAASVDHLGGQLARQTHRADQVQVHLTVEIFEVALGGVAWQHASGVVNEDVDTAAFQHLGHEAVDTLLAGEVEDQDLGHVHACARRHLALDGRGLKLLLAPRTEYHLRPFLREGFGDCCADAPAGTGDQDFLASQHARTH
eukprot:CAMPEP_0170258612 /NCGR_PEP_ID=MMETSP0116_2-20130129/29172_1 /TAXON_ID=400756 /ORGANISM="Durinskia baltica, Strain CSIRO CS-38" /LENGTH=247 /DNA_ID=CAMNT_0010509647 /DNA_START=58 /DNA_END=798 /DNA_ORIENTATION=+